MEMDTTGFRPQPATVFFNAGVAGSRRLTLLREIGPAQESLPAEYDLLDVASDAFLTGLRIGKAGCVASLAHNQDSSVIFGVDTTQAYAVSSAFPTTPGPLTFAPLGLTLTTFGGVSVHQRWSLSATTLAFDLEPAGRIVVVPMATPAARVVSKPANALASPTVVGTDALAIEQDGNGDGWSRIVRIDPDGTLVPWRAIPNHRVRTLVVDGATAYWTECFGLAQPKDLAQPNVEAWTATYDRDPQIMAATAQKLGDLPSGRCIADDQVLAQNGIFLAVSGDKNVAIRRSDKQALTFMNGLPRYAWIPLVITPTELWSIEGIAAGARGVALTRLALPSW